MSTVAKKVSVTEAMRGRLQMLDAATGYAGISQLVTKEDKRLLRLGWVAKRPEGAYRITRNGRAALKRYAGYTSVYGGAGGHGR